LKTLGSEHNTEIDETFKPEESKARANFNTSHALSATYVPPLNPMTVDDTAPVMGIRHESVPPPMRLGAMADGGGVDPGDDPAPL
jgi:hypothetical protein